MMDRSQYMTWDDIEVGAQLPPFQYTVTAEDVEKYGQAVEDLEPWNLDDQAARDAGWGGRIAQPTCAAVWIIPSNVLYPKPGPPGRIHAKQYYEFHRPARVGDTLTVTVTTVDKFIRRERRYSIQESITTNQDGELVVTARNSIIWPF